MGITIGIAVVAGLLVGYVIWTYNRLVRLRIRCENGWSQIDVQLKRRYDLIPNLVETVQGYADHERQTLEAVIEARGQAIDATGIAAQGQAENLLTAMLGRLFALSEAYPDLKADGNFMQLQEELVSTENKIGYARQHYNDVVARFNTMIQVFPASIIAGMFKFQQRSFFEVETAAERRVVNVNFDRTQTP